MSVHPFVCSMCKSLFKAPFPSIHINFKHRSRILVTQGTFLAISGESWRADMENISIFVIFYPLVNKSIYKSLSVRLFVYWICKSLIKTPFPSIHINFKHRHGILVTQETFLAIFGANWKTDEENIPIFVILHPIVNKSFYKSLSIRLFVRWICKSLNKTPSHQFISTLSIDSNSKWLNQNMSLLTHVSMLFLRNNLQFVYKFSPFTALGREEIHIL